MYVVHRARLTPAALTGGRPSRSPSPTVDITTGPVGGERQAPPQRLPTWQDDRTAASTLPVVAALLGGSQAPPTSRHVKPFACQISAASARQGASRDWV